MSPWVLLLLGLGVVLLITVATGYFVAQEFAYMAVDRTRLTTAAQRGDKGAQRALKVTRRTSFMLSGAQLGITVTGLLVGYAAEPMIGEALGALLGGVGVPAGVGLAVGTVIGLVLATVIQMLFGELFPKNLAIARPEPVARWLSRSTLLYLAVFGWLIWVFDQASNLLLRALGITPVHDLEYSASSRDLEALVARSRESGDLSPDLSLLLDRILTFPSEDVEHAMRPRSRTGTVRPDLDLAALRDLMASGHSRYPVMGEEDQILGVVHLEDLLRSGSTPQVVADLMRPALVVPTAMSLPDVARELATSGERLACVVDEYGGLAGIVTAEDLAEELVGEVADEFDPTDDAPVAVFCEDRWELPGDIPVDEVERALGIELPDGDFETFAGLVLDTLGRLPEIGEQVEIALELTAEDILETDDGDSEPTARSIQVEVLEVERFVPSRMAVRL